VEPEPSGERAVTLAGWLEVLNGATAIVTGFFILHLLAHTSTVYSLKDIPKGPLGLQIVLAQTVTVSGWFGRSFVMWYARSTIDNQIVPDTSVALWLILSTLLCIVGYLLLLRMITNVTYGNWPWISTAVVLLVYIGVALRMS
jgi:hypothetical protein